MSCMKIKMFLVSIYCVFQLLLLSKNYAMRYPKSKCYKNDCFYQLPDFKNEKCMIYNTSVCLDRYKFDGASEETYKEESKFLVEAFPYTAELFVYALTASRSAVNFTFIINSTDIKELAVKIYTKVSPRPICRIFDLQNVNKSQSLPISLYYDCLSSMVEHGMQKVRMDFITLPALKNQSYYVFIPGTKYPGSCTWQSLVMVFNGALQNGEVQVKFSQAPELYNVSSYLVKLTENTSGDEKIVDIIPDVHKRMLVAQFSSVNDGVYSVSVKPIFRRFNDNCWAETDTFLVKNTKSGYMVAIYLCVFILLLFSALIFFKMFGWNVAKMKYGSKRRVLLVYTHDCSEHTDFVLAFVDFLIKYCYVEVSTIYGDEYNPEQWIKKKYQESDIIMYLISAGLFHTLDSKHFRHVQTGHEWRHQTQWTTAIIFSELLNNFEDMKMKKICKVCFPYSSKEHIPNRLCVGYGKCYFLPKEMNNLMNFMHDSQECFPCSKLCVPDFKSSTKITILLEKIKAVQAAVDNNSHIRIITPFSNTNKNDFNFGDDSDRMQIQDNTSTSSDENTDSIINILSGNKEIYSVTTSENIRPTTKGIHLAELELEYGSAETSDSEESDFLFYHPKPQNETEAKYVIESILKNEF